MQLSALDKIDVHPGHSYFASNTCTDDSVKNIWLMQALIVSRISLFDQF